MKKVNGKQFFFTLLTVLVLLGLVFSAGSAKDGVLKKTEIEKAKKGIRFIFEEMLQEKGLHIHYDKNYFSVEIPEETFKKTITVKYYQYKGAKVKFEKKLIENGLDREAIKKELIDLADTIDPWQF